MVEPGHFTSIFQTRLVVGEIVLPENLVLENCGSGSREVVGTRYQRENHHKH